MIKNIVFDIGNVLAGFVWEEYYHSFGFSDETFQKLAAATVKGPYWHEFDQGNLSTEEVIQGFKDLDPSISAEIDQIYADINGMVAKYDYAEGWIRELKDRGYAVYLISNISEKVVQDCRAAMPFLDKVDGAILSWQEKMQKPDDAIYRLFLERFRCNPAECIFLDDQEKNIISAEKQGMKGILFQNYNQAIIDLEKQLSESNQE